MTNHNADKILKINNEIKSHLRHWIIIDVNDFVQVSNDDFRDRCQLLEIKRSLRCHVHVQSDRRQVAHSHLQPENQV